MTKSEKQRIAEKLRETVNLFPDHLIHTEDLDRDKLISLYEKYSR